jgi:hypothetical protein
LWESQMDLTPQAEIITKKIPLHSERDQLFSMKEV